MNILKLKGIDNMIFDVYASNISQLPEIKEIYAEINENPSNSLPKISAKDNRFLAYIGLMYDRNSPLRRNRIEQRKLIAIEQARMNEVQAKQATLLSGKRVVMLVHYFLKYQADYEWAHYCTVAELYWNNQQIILEGSTKNDPKEQETIIKINNSQKVLIEDLNTLKDGIFGDNKEKVEEIIKFSPEDYALELSNTGNLAL